MPTLTTGPEAAADGTEAEAALNGIASAATSTADSARRRRHDERPVARVARTSTRALAPMVPPQATTDRRPKIDVRAPYEYTSRDVKDAKDRGSVYPAVSPHPGGAPPEARR